MKSANSYYQSTDLYMQMFKHTVKITEGSMAESAMN